MRPGFIIAVLLSIASMSTASMLFLDGSSPPLNLKSVPSLIQIKWGEGSEAGVPEGALHQ